MKYTGASSYVRLAFGLGIFAMIINENQGKPTSANESGHIEATAFKKKARPTPGSSPLDPNETIASELDSLNAILGVLGTGTGGIVQGLTGISIHDCAGEIKGQDLNSLTCGQFIEALSGCESLHNVKDLLQAAKKKYNKKPNSKEPCFQDSKKSKKSKNSKKKP